MSVNEFPVWTGGSFGSIEPLLFDLAQAFQWPITVLVLLVFLYAILKLGGFVVEAISRQRRPNQILVLPQNGSLTIESMQLLVLRELEGLRLCSRIAPMLGLVATMIPLGPALVAVSSGETQLTMQALGTAFAAVIVALVAASICFLIYTVRRRWLLQELNQWLALQPITGESEVR
ncbi:MotA/TolQ/ExbB proton channel family protein [Stieleria sp. TO1_6]|uniref:MotA/TolQ/ExbB proton channel family protein n=1 Tax=Stieleria tagensis TaxID=2956795 RepID=UPI00209B3A5A|nr:MotA/TolQ/ExbB proton channel family protein [Stieleria tagensis]MCO8121061.1 MotA/TolQ/ExbB proton channel family protein [Stieleria tagensis]